MVNVQPFRGLRYDEAVVGDWGSVLGPPYDIVNEAQTAALKASSEYQIAHIETAAGEEIEAAAAKLAAWREAGAVVRDEQPAYYFHEHYIEDGSGKVRIRRALFGAVELSEWGRAGVMAHERTMPGPKATRTALRSVVGADVSPLMAFVPDAAGDVNSWMTYARTLPLLHDGVDPAGERHTLRRVDEPAAVERIGKLLARERLYMADGHHRYESALAARDARAGSGYVLMGIVCGHDEALVVGATHRVLHRELPDDLLERLRELFSVRESSVEELPSLLPDGSADIGFVTAEGAWRLGTLLRVQEAMPAGLPHAWKRLAPAILQYVILEPLLGVDAEALAGGEAVTYTHHLAEVEAAVAGGAGAGFVLPAPTLRDVIVTADEGSFMPQKSTYFVPKLPTGLVLHPMD